MPNRSLVDVRQREGARAFIRAGGIDRAQRAGHWVIKMPNGKRVSLPTGHDSHFTVAVHAAEEGGYWGEVLELPGCMSQGETEEDLRRNIIDAIEAILDSYAEDGEEPPIQDQVVKLLRVRV